MPKYLDETGLAHFWDNISDAIGDVRNFAKGNTYGQYVDDITYVRSMPTPSGYTMAAMCFDSNGRLYVSFCKSGANSIVHYYDDFVSIENDETITPTGTFETTNTHCNSMVVMDGNKLCISDWNVAAITLIDLSNNFAEETITTPFTMRTCSPSFDNIIVQPYDANKFYLLCKSTKSDSFTDGYYLPLPANAQVSYVQDCTTISNCIYRLCSSGRSDINNGGSYVEIYPIYSGGGPIEVALTTDYDAEFEGITQTGNYIYLSTANSNIYKTNKLRNIAPQIRGVEATFWGQMHNYLLSSAQRQIAHVPYTKINDTTYRLYLPSILNTFVGNRTLQLFVSMKMHGFTGDSGWHSGGSITTLVTHQQGTEQASLVGNLSNGIYFVLITANYNATGGYVDIGMNQYREITVSGGTVSMTTQGSMASFTLQNPDFNLSFTGTF